MRVHRAIWQPSTRVSRAQTRWPSTRPLTIATCGPPKISVHTTFAGTGAKARQPTRESSRHAAARRGSVPPTGSQRSDQRTRSDGRFASSTYTMLSTVGDGRLRHRREQDERTAEDEEDAHLHGRYAAGRPIGHRRAI